MSTTINNINILIEMKTELNELLLDELSPSIFNGLMTIYKEAKKISNNTTIMITFQKCLEKIVNWDDIQTNEAITICNKILGDGRFEKLEKMRKAILKLNTLIMNNGDKSKLKDMNQITQEQFFKKVYIECARNFYSQPFLFNDKLSSSIEIKRNHLIITDIIRKSILSAIRRLLDFDNLPEKNEFKDREIISLFS